MRSAHNAGPTTDQEAQQEEFLGALQALGSSAGNGRLRELLTWEEAPYEAVKASLLASGQLRTGRGRGGSVSLADGAGDEGADRLVAEWSGLLAEAGGSLAEAGGSLAPAEGGQGPARSAPARTSARPDGTAPSGPKPAASRTSRPSSGAWPTCCGATTSRATTAR